MNYKFVEASLHPNYDQSILNFASNKEIRRRSGTSIEDSIKRKVRITHAVFSRQLLYYARKHDMWKYLIISDVDKDYLMTLSPNEMMRYQLWWNNEQKKRAKSSTE